MGYFVRACRAAYENAARKRGVSGRRFLHGAGAAAAILSAFGLASCSASPPAVTSPPPGFVSGRVTAIGDSVMLAAKPDLVAQIPNVTVDAVVGRQWGAGLALARHLRATNSLGTTVIIELGTNGPVDASQFQLMMSALSGATLVVFDTVHVPSSYSWWQSVNATLREGVAKYANARLADFNSLGNANPQWFGSDGIHMVIGGPGAQAMASLIARTIKAAEGRLP